MDYYVLVLWFLLSDITKHYESGSGLSQGRINTYFRKTASIFKRDGQRSYCTLVINFKIPWMLAMLEHNRGLNHNSYIPKDDMHRF